jgi:hypothetical protein
MKPTLMSESEVSFVFVLSSSVELFEQPAKQATANRTARRTARSFFASFICFPPSKFFIIRQIAE